MRWKSGTNTHCQTSRIIIRSHRRQRRAAEAEVLANRYADMAARERRETRLAILAATVIVGTVIFVCRNKDGGIEVDTAKYYLNSSSCVN